MKQTIVHPTVGEVTICSTRLNRRISLAVRANGQVRLSYPTYVSTKRALEFLEEKTEWILKAKARAAAKNSTPPITPTQRELLRTKAKAYLPQRVAQIAEACGLRYNKLTIRATRSKWGSCSGENNLSLSLYLMLLPSHLIDYVIIHELCHTIHHNHSPRFHALVNSLVGGKEKELAKELRSYRINL